MSADQLVDGDTAGGAVLEGPPARPPADGIVCRVAADFDALAPMRAEWDEFVACAGGDIYFTFDWCRTWWRHYGGYYRLCVLLFRRQDRLVGLLPMMIDRLWCGPVPLKMAKLLGSDLTPVVLNPPVLPDHAEDVYARAFAVLLDRLGCDAVRLAPLAGDRPHRERIRQACAAGTGRFRLVRDTQMLVHATVPLAESSEHYLAGLPGEHRRELRRLRRRLETRHTVALELVDQPGQVEAAFEEFLAMHRARWQDRGGAGSFEEFPGALAFHRDLVRALARHGRVSISRLRVDGELAAGTYDFRLGNTLYGRLTARRCGQQWDRLSIGLLALVYLFEECMARTIRQVNTGVGSHIYKRQLGAVESPLVSLIVAADRPAARLKVGPLLRLWWWLINLVYQRLWYRRIVPRLPTRFRRPFWHVWLRCRI